MMRRWQRHHTASEHMRAGRWWDANAITHGKLVGIISRTDFFAAHLVDQRGQVRKWQVGVPKLRAQDIMSRKVQSALPETLVSKLVAPMVDQGLHQIPIVDASNRVVGMVSQADLLSGLFSSGFERLPESPEQPQSIGDANSWSVPACRVAP